MCVWYSVRTAHGDVFRLVLGGDGSGGQDIYRSIFDYNVDRK